MVVVSVLTLVRPEALPATVLLIVMPLGVFMAFTASIKTVDPEHGIRSAQRSFLRLER